MFQSSKGDFIEPFLEFLVKFVYKVAIKHPHESNQLDFWDIFKHHYTFDFLRVVKSGLQKNQKTTLNVLRNNISNDDANNQRDGKPAVSQHILAITAFNCDVRNDIAYRIQQPNKADAQNLNQDRTNNWHQAN